MATMIGVIGKSTLYAGIGDVITANVKEASPGGTVKKGEVVAPFVVRTRTPIRRTTVPICARQQRDCHHRQGI